MVFGATWGWFLLGAFGAEVIGTMAGFGAATILTPIAALFMDVKIAIAVVACFHLFGNASRLVFFGRSIRWSVWAQFGFTGVLCSLAGAAATSQLPSVIVQLVFGLFLLLYVGLSTLPSKPMQLPQTRATLMGGGAVSGFIAGLIGTGGAIRSACLLVFDLPKEAYIGTSAAIALIVDATRVPVYLAGGLLLPTTAPLIAALVGVAVAGSWVGQRLVRRVSAAAFRQIVMAMLGLMGMKMCLEGWRGAW